MTELRGSSKRRGAHPFRLDLMPKACRDLARKFMASHAKGEAAVHLSGDYPAPRTSNLEAARSLERQAERWQREIDTGEPNVEDRAKIGELE